MAECSLKGAIIGAPVLGVLGFITGIVVVTAWNLPVPPLLTFEAGCLLGAILGGLVGAIVAYRLTRCMFFGILGTLALIALAVPLLHARLHWSDIQRLLLVGIIVGANAGLMSSGKPAAHP